MIRSSIQELLSVEKGQKMKGASSRPTVTVGWEELVMLECSRS